jgi:parallel beta-helix repeat protein
MSQIFSRRITLAFFSLFALFICGTRAKATDITGTISTTLTILKDSQLVGDVTCMVADAPCIAFGAPSIKLRLNGFTITGRADPPAGCISTSTYNVQPEDGIAVVAQHDVAILGPGLVQKFGRHGIRLLGSTKARVKGVTASDNCFSGIILTGTTDSDIEKNVSVRNAIGSNGFACGGT